MVGKKEQMVWNAETGWAEGGTPLTDGEVVGYDCEITPDWSNGFQERLTGAASDLYVQGRDKGPLMLPYTMTFTPYSWRFMKYLMSVSDGTDGGTYTHTFTQNTSIQSYALEWAKRHTTNHVLTLMGNAIKKITISFSKATGEGREGYVRVACECVGKSVSQDSSVSSVSDIAYDPFLFRHIKVTIGGTEYKEVNNGEITIDLGINEEDSRYCNTTYDNELGEVIPGIMRISGRYNINIKDETIYNHWEGATPITGTNSLLFDRDGTGNDQCLFTFDDYIIHGGIASTNMEGPTNVDVVWTADSFSSVVARDSITPYA